MHTFFSFFLTYVTHVIVYSVNCIYDAYRLNYSLYGDTFVRVQPEKRSHTKIPVQASSQFFVYDGFSTHGVNQSKVFLTSELSEICVYIYKQKHF